MRKLRTIGVAGAVLAGAGAVYLAMAGGHTAKSADAIGGVSASARSLSETTAAPTDERERAWQDAIAKGAVQKDAWPRTPEALIREFWQSAARKDTDRLLVLCPGSIADDFKLMERWTPSPATAIGAAARDPQNPSVVLYPVTVPFPNFPNKTIKMAIGRLRDGRLIVDGQKTIWW